jgi:hypothetical protein
LAENVWLLLLMISRIYTSCVLCLQPDISRDEYLFPMTGQRLSFVSSPESDYDVASNRARNVPYEMENGYAASRGAPPSSWNKLARASSDPSIATVENPAGPIETNTGLSGAVSGVDVSHYGHEPPYVSVDI